MNSLIQLFKALNANQHPGQIALSLLIGMWLGLTPFFFPHTLILVLLIFVLRINVSAVLVSWAIFTGLAYAFDPLFHQFGIWVLNHPELVGLWTAWYNDAFWRFLGFNNTVVMGSILVTALLSVPFFVASWFIIRVYRHKFLVWVNKFKVVQMLKASDKAQTIARLMS